DAQCLRIAYHRARIDAVDGEVRTRQVESDGHTHLIRADAAAVVDDHQGDVAVELSREDISGRSAGQVDRAVAVEIPSVCENISLRSGRVEANRLARQPHDVAAGAGLRLDVADHAADRVDLRFGRLPAGFTAVVARAVPARTRRCIENRDGI